jgi:hypothetical protein
VLTTVIQYFFLPLLQAFEKCVIRDWNLSYECLTGAAIRSKLRTLRETDPTFWGELTVKETNTTLPPENIPQPEDQEIFDGGLDDSDVPIDAVIGNVISEGAPKGYTVSIGGGLEADADAERFEECAPKGVDGDGDGGEKELGRGKRRKQANRLYPTDFWCHDS